MEKLGIESLKKAIASLMAIGVAVDTALEDTNISRAEAISIGFKSVSFGGVLAFNWKAIKAEFADLDDTERQEIKDFVKSEFDLEDDYVEEKVEKGFNVAIAVEDFFSVKKAA